MTVEAMVDLERYPVHDLGSDAGRRLVAACRAALAREGVMMLPGFLRPDATELMAREAEAIKEQAFFKEVVGNPYLEPVDETLPEDHPRRLTESTLVGALAYDQIPSTHALRQLYEWDTMLDFLAAALGKERLYRYADTMGALNVAVMREGDYLRWHFDQTDFVVSLALQEPETGGDFEYVPLVRSRSEENYGAVRDVLLGKSDRVRRLPVTPGALILFEGRHSLHRVTKVGGARTRLMGLFGYDTRPGVVSTEHLRYMRYGRA